MPFRVYTATDLRAMDRHTIEFVGIPSPVLMELAGRAVAEELLAEWSEACAEGVLIVAGRGNNGGDAWVLARLLHQRKVAVEVVALPGERTEDCALNERIAHRIGVPCRESFPASAPGLIVDGIFGTGIRGDVRGLAREWIAHINRSATPVVSIDLPSGLCGDTGKIFGEAVCAAMTIAVGYAKTGLFGATSSESVGRIRVVNIGLVGPQEPAAEVVCGKWVEERMPVRSAGGHKGQSGHLVVIAGSQEHAGAAVLCCNAAVALGCGMVSLAIHPAAKERLGALAPEVMVEFLEDPRALDWKRFSAAAVGPGFGTNSTQKACLKDLFLEADLPAVFDADGLTSLGEAPKPSPHPRCLTPHPGEAARLLGCTPAEIQADRWGAIRRLSEVAPCLLKGRYSLIAKQGCPTRINLTGTAALSTAGSGDVLTGMVGALLAQGVEPHDALTSAAFLHGWVATRSGRSRLAASELVQRLGEAIDSVGECSTPLPTRSLIGP